jgi:hypothetical protein
MVACFDTLPPEIRLKIYQQLLAGIRLRRRNAFAVKKSAPEWSPPVTSMLLVSKLHRSECTSLNSAKASTRTLPCSGFWQDSYRTGRPLSLHQTELQAMLAPDHGDGVIDAP